MKIKPTKSIITEPKGIWHASCLFFASLFLLILASCSGHVSADSEAAVSTTNKISEVTKSQPDAAPELAFTSIVRSIFEDSKGNFWFGSDREGVCRFDGHSFTYFTTQDGLSHNQIRTIQEDQQGNIWLATGAGVSRYDGEKFTVHTAKDNLEFGIRPIGKWSKKPTDLWFNGEVEGGIYRYNGQHFEILEFPQLDSDHESFSISGTVTGICKGKDNLLWMANYGGVIGYNGESFTYINERKFKYHVRSILEDSKGNLWIGNNGIGVLLYDGKSTINFSKRDGVSDHNNLSSGAIYGKNTLNHVFAVAEDRNGNIWFGDRDTGAWRFDGNVLKNFTVKDGLSNLFVRTIYQDRNGELWVGMDEGKVARFNGVSFDEMYEQFE